MAMFDSQSGDDSSLEIKRDAAVDMADFYDVISSYFPRLAGVSDLKNYCRGCQLGSPSLFLAYWHDRPAAVHAVFPFPLWICGSPTVGGKPEFASLHPDVAHQYPRPDIFAVMIDAMVARARERALPLLVAWPSLLSLKSHRKRGFRELPMPHTTATWLLQQTRAEALHAIRQAPGILRKGKAFARVMIKALYTSSLCLTTRWQRFDIQEIAVDELEGHRGMIEANDWPANRITVQRDVDFIRSRIRERSGIRVLAIRCDAQVQGIVFAQLQDGILYVYDVLPAWGYRQVAWWRALLRYGLSISARAVSARMFHNNPAHMDGLAVIRRQLPALLQQGQLRLAALALDPALEFAYDPMLWYGTDMLGMGF